MAEYYAICTDVGAAKLTQALALGQPVVLTHIAVGDGNGAAYTPSGAQTTLRREVYRAPINALTTHADNPNWLVAECVLPASVGGWTIREAGVVDEDGTLIVIAKTPEAYKATLSSGAGQDLYFRFVIQHASTAAVTLKVDPSVVLATRAYVDDRVAAHVAAANPHTQYALKAEVAAALTAHAQSREHPDATTELKGMVELATPAETVAGADSVRATTPAGVKAAIAALVDGSPAALDTLRELAAALANDANFAATMAQQLALKAPLKDPAFTGAPTAPTPDQFDASKKLANTESVQRALGNHQDIRAMNASAALTAADAGKLVCLTGSAATVVATLPNLSDVVPGASFAFVNVGSVAASVTATGTDRIDKGGTPVAGIAVGVGDTLELCSNGAYWTLVGGSAALPFASGFQAFLARPGYQRLPSGLIMQWVGTGNLPPNGYLDVTLPIAFPHAACVALVSWRTASQLSDTAAGLAVDPVSASVVRVYQTTAASTRNAVVLVIGY